MTGKGEFVEIQGTAEKKPVQTRKASIFCWNWPGKASKNIRGAAVGHRRGAQKIVQNNNVKKLKECASTPFFIAVL